MRTVTCDRNINNSWVESPHSLDTKSQAFHGPRPQVMADDVRAGDQPLGNRDVPRMFKIQNNRPFSTVGAAQHRLAKHAQVARYFPSRRLNFNYIRTHLRELLSSARNRYKLTEIGDSDP
ncbi:hypothetical protein GCM10009715_41610 [Paeniglutamicibacter psychrophenolicus]